MSRSLACRLSPAADAGTRAASSTRSSPSAARRQPATEMPHCVLDASAVLAVVFKETGTDLVAEALRAGRSHVPVGRWQCRVRASRPSPAPIVNAADELLAERLRGCRERVVGPFRSRCVAILADILDEPGANASRRDPCPRSTRRRSGMLHDGRLGGRGRRTRLRRHGPSRSTPPTAAERKLPPTSRVAWAGFNDRCLASQLAAWP